MQERLDPLVISWGYESAAPSHSQFKDYNERQGTRDISAFLTIPRAIQFLNENNWTAVSAACRTLVLKNYERICAVLGSHPFLRISTQAYNSQEDIDRLIAALGRL